MAPPRFAPHQQSVITLYDRIFQAMVAGGLLTEPTTTSYTADIYPILQRARDTRWVERTQGSHLWPDPVISDDLRSAIFAKLKIPGGGGGNMPRINDSGTRDDRLTQVQYDHMQRWQNNDFTNDWTGVPAPQAVLTPEGLDRAALEACVGGAFYPGIEAGGLPDTGHSRPIILSSNFVEPFRLNHSVVSPGGITYEMALPWQNDFYQCSSNWWPVPRPNRVIRQGVPDSLFTAGVVTSAEDMVEKWHQLGFILRDGVQHTEFDRCDIASIQLLTPILNFQDVPQGPLGMVHEVPLAITFEVISPTSSVTLQYAPMGAPSHAQLVAFNISDTVGPTSPNAVATARLWVIYRTSTVGSVLPPQTVIVQDSTGSHSWTITIFGNTVSRKTAAAALVLDRSGSMSEDQGDGQTKHESLQLAASIFVDVMLEGDGIGIVRFNEDAQVLQNVVPLGKNDLSDINRGNTKDIINGTGLDPGGETSIGDGIFEGRNVLNSTATPFDVKSLVVLTDGMENMPRTIAEVSPQINEYTYAIGLGKPENISVPALQVISGNNGGYLLVTGAIDLHNRFMLQKYFLQLLTGISSAEVVLDPCGELVPGQIARIPFQLIGGDAGVDVILLTPDPSIIDFRLEAPSGTIIEPWLATADPNMRFVLSNGVSYYRIALPIEFMTNRFDGGGTWHALLRISAPRLERSNTRDGSDHSIRYRDFPSKISTPRAANVGNLLIQHPSTQGAAQQIVNYCLSVQSYSNLSLQARLGQTGFEPGATVRLEASLTQSGISFSAGAQVTADVKRPDGTETNLTLILQSENQFTATFITSLPGVYQIRIRARGTARGGELFTRERTLTAAVWRGLDHNSNPGNNGRVI
ncbi:MAG TPA: LodA/GoxA family CTQ-dependent oxidase [Nitrososphaera sp.]